MFSLPVVMLSTLVLVLSGAVLILAFQLRSVKMSREEADPPPARTESTEIAALRQIRGKAAQLCLDIKRSLTHICAAIPSAIPGLAIERIYFLCANELKDRVTDVSKSFGKGVADRFAAVIKKQDLAILQEQLDRLDSVSEEIKRIDLSLECIFKTWSDNSDISFDDYEERLAAVSREIDEVHDMLRSVLCSMAEKWGDGESALSVQKHMEQASAGVSDLTVRAALADLQVLAQRHYDLLDRQTKTCVESYYLETLELMLNELGKAELTGEDVDTRKELCLRVIRVLSDVFTAGRQAEREIKERNLEAEVTALERLAAMRGDIGS